MGNPTEDERRPPPPPSEIETMANYAKLLRSAAMLKQELGKMVRRTVPGARQGRGGLADGCIRLSWQGGEASCGPSGWTVCVWRHGAEHEAVGTTLRGALESLPDGVEWCRVER